MELGHAFYLASDGVSCSHSGGDALCIMDEIAFDLPLRHQIVLAEKTAHFPTALLNESDSLLQASPLTLPFIIRIKNRRVLYRTFRANVCFFLSKIFKEKKLQSHTPK